jgi:uracil-DNA glycosylase
VTDRPGVPAQLAGSLRAHFDALPPAWRVPLAGALAQASLAALIEYVDARVDAGHAVYPPRPLAALADAAPGDVRVVILGQDPYHGPGQAQGYAFSVAAGQRLPPSLRNIHAELARDCGCAAPRSGSLQGWSAQGVLLLNTVLTVEQGQPASHARRGWEDFTDAVLDVVARQPGAKAFLLWGAHAQAKRARIAAAGTPQLVLCANHPSPLSARRAPEPFLGCAHFSRTNQYLVGQGRAPIDWCRCVASGPA